MERGDLLAASVAFKLVTAAHEVKAWATAALTGEYGMGKPVDRWKYLASTRTALMTTIKLTEEYKYI